MSETDIEKDTEIQKEREREREKTDRQMDTFPGKFVLASDPQRLTRCSWK